MQDMKYVTKSISLNIAKISNMSLFILRSSMLLLNNIFYINYECQNQNPVTDKLNVYLTFNLVESKLLLYVGNSQIINPFKMTSLYQISGVFESENFFVVQNIHQNLCVKAMNLYFIIAILQLKNRYEMVASITLDLQILYNPIFKLRFSSLFSILEFC